MQLLAQEEEKLKRSSQPKTNRKEKPKPTVSRTPITPKAKSAPAKAQSSSTQTAVSSMFERVTPNDLLKGIVYSEVLGKPLSLRKERFRTWR